MYQALYRKWRPQTFDQVVGQDHITHTLKNQVRTGRLSHAYLFIGTRGTGKTTCARILAKAVNCAHPVDGNPCGECEACRSIAEGSAMDVVELDAASNNSVENVRSLRDEAVFSPTRLKKRVYIIDEVHMLSLSAFNALLKILEEPPEHLMFILATTELHKVPATILSRCQRHSFRRVETGTLTGYLTEIAGRENFKLSPDAAALIARMAEGGVRDALSLLDQCSAAEEITVDAVYSAMGLAGKRRIAELLNHILRRDREKALSLFSQLWMEGKSPLSILGELSALLRDSLLLKIAPRSAGDLLAGGYDEATLKYFAGRMTEDELLYAMDSLQRAICGMKDSANPKTAGELCLITLCMDPAAESIGHLRARISRLEEQIEMGRFPGRTDPGREQVLTTPTDRDKPFEDEAFQDAEPEESLPEEVQERGYEETGPQADSSCCSESEEDRGTVRPQEQTLQESDSAWEQIRDRAAALVTREIRGSLKDETKVRGHIEGDALVLEAAPGFLFGRFNLPETKKKLEEATVTALGKKLRVQVRELSDCAREKRDLNELSGFKEVSFV